MPARVSFLLGRSGAGKSRCLHGRISELLGQGESVSLIVPEQFTFETERLLSERLGGLMGVSVYSFTTLARKVLGESHRAFLSRQGRAMAVRKAVGELGPKLAVFARVKDRPGFAAALDEQLAMFKRFDVAPDMLSEAAGKLPQGAPLADKLRELALIYGRVEGYLRERYMDTEDCLNALIAALPGSPLAGGHVMIDGFDLLTGQLYRVMERLMETSATLAISFRLDHSPNCRDRQVFAPEHRAYARLYRRAQDLGCPIDTALLPLDGERRAARPDLLHLEREAFAFPFAPYGEEAPSISLFAAANVASECEAAAEEVLRLAKSGLRYRDINVICADPAYQLQLLRAFRRRDIPCFSDAARPLSYYGGPRLILCALRCVTRGYSLPCLMALARTGFAGVEQGELDAFENHALRLGARGQGFAKPFDDPAAEKVRLAIMEPLVELRANLAAAPTAALKAEAVFGYMQRLGIYGTAKALCGELRREGRLELAEENAQVYSLMLTVLDQLHGIMGEVKTSGPRFLQVLEEGFEAYEVNAIPATADQVIIGSLGKTHSRDAKAMLILGANEGKFPRYRGEEGMIGDGEMQALSRLGLPPWDSSRDRYDVELMDVYCALSKATERLYISYAMSAGSEASAPSPLVDRIMEIYPGIAPDTDLAPRPPQSPQGGLGELARGLRAMVDGGKAPEGLPELYAYYAGKPQYRDELDRLESALYYRCSPEPFGRELALRLYGDVLFGSATRLERYNGCPFRHFVNYGLRAQERKEYRERKADEGAFCHAALEAFVKEASKADIRELSEEDCRRILDGILPRLIAEHNGGVLASSPRNRALCARLIRAVKATAWAIVRQAGAGGFTPKGTEVTFGRGGLPALRLDLPTGESFLIGGRIDRIDGCTLEGEEYYRVVDYKANAGFDYARLYHGLSLQLPLYVAAISAVERAARPAGMYYMPVKDPVLAEEESGMEQRLLREFRLSGLTLSDPEIVSATAGDGSCPVIATGHAAKGFATGEEMESLVSYAKAKSRETLERMYRGGAEASPAKLRERCECDYCESRSICGFDQRIAGCQCRSLKPLSRDAFFEAIGKEGQDALDR